MPTPSQITALCTRWLQSGTLALDSAFEPMVPPQPASIIPEKEVKTKLRSNVFDFAEDELGPTSRQKDTVSARGDYDM